tara:strand:+ start:120 stop:584 length:465 start_codon:yes stop_codon:yes gene_type:complete
MIYRLDLPPLVLPEIVHRSDLIAYQAVKVNFTAYDLKDDVYDILANHIPNEILTASLLRYQESDHTLNTNPHRDVSNWKINYMIDPAGGILNSYDDNGVINKTINQLAGEWVLINANEMHCPVDVTGTRKSISLQHRFKFTETEQTWIDSHIIE